MKVDSNDNIYVVPAKTLRTAEKMARSLTEKYTIMPLRWVEARSFFNCVIPSGVFVTEQVKGSLTFNCEGRLVSLYPI